MLNKPDCCLGVVAVGYCEVDNFFGSGEPIGAYSDFTGVVALV